MRITWVLSLQERERRFTKIKAKSDGAHKSTKLSIGRSLNPCFTIEEKSLLEDVNTNFEYPWLEKFFKYDSSAALNWLEYTFCEERLDEKTWQKMGESMFQNYTEIVMPKFPELQEIPAADFYYLCHHSGHVVNFFRSCFAVKLPSSDSYDGIRPYLNSIQLQVSTQIYLLPKIQILLGLLFWLKKFNQSSPNRDAFTDETFPFLFLLLNAFLFWTNILDWFWSRILLIRYHPSWRTGATVAVTTLRTSWLSPWLELTWTTWRRWEWRPTRACTPLCPLCPLIPGPRTRRSGWCGVCRAGPGPGEASGCRDSSPWWASSSPSAWSTSSAPAS